MPRRLPLATKKALQSHCCMNKPLIQIHDVQSSLERRTWESFSLREKGLTQNYRFGNYLHTAFNIHHFSQTFHFIFTAELFLSLGVAIIS